MVFLRPKYTIEILYGFEEMFADEINAFIDCLQVRSDHFHLVYH